MMTTKKKIAVLTSGGDAQGMNAVAASGEDFVRIGLMADVPDKPVAGRVKNVMKRNRQFHSA